MALKRKRSRSTNENEVESNLSLIKSEKTREMLAKRGIKELFPI